MCWIKEGWEGVGPRESWEGVGQRGVRKVVCFGGVKMTCFLRCSAWSRTESRSPAWVRGEEEEVHQLPNCQTVIT